ncbi:endonuclease/exonuclease/phosphatase family protein [Isoptericola sp. NEAU-Y5]|uniref:Endonuclease/exonuclease/phosphatase family protein n=1 Tax=Isoptericola luteus TaxID=2879484 RepID=A0ABS7ZKC2_9MICO|nr:endonuclease/exonuclease/phosphatase family protein [Isoptericola sp. NEAU-Y5]MCA5894084.1 endonuclease/exonuclease/phosphatase family protein [Isoptericola sp. NEAU-Y5]
MIRLVTSNVQHAAVGGEHVDLERLAHALAGLDGDVVALQEVDRGQDRSGGADQARVLAGALGMTEHRFVPTLRGQTDDWLRRRRARGDEPAATPGYGIALMTRLPVRRWHQVRLPAFALPGAPPPGVDEPRAALAAVVETPDGPLTVVTTHLTKLRALKWYQLAALRRRLRGAPRPLVVLGDLNQRDDVPAHRTGWTELVRVPTYPAERPRLRLDHVLTDGPVEAVGTARAVDLGVSDHRAVVVDVGLTAGTPRAGAPSARAGR